MIQITVYQNSGKAVCGYEANGHAGYADEGFDIICASVSVLTQNTANSIEKFTDDPITGESGDGYLKIMLPGKISPESKLLLDSMILGLSDIVETYGKKYVKIRFKEV